MAKWGEKFLARVYTPKEIERYRNRVPELAARFAGKEAVMKVLGTGEQGGRMEGDRDSASAERKADGEAVSQGRGSGSEAGVGGGGD